MKHHKYQYVVICRTYGIQPLEYTDYLEQLKRANSRWECPCCGQNASWDDECLETNPVEFSDGPPEILQQAVSPDAQPDTNQN